MLAGLFKAPAKYAPHVNLPAARARANVVLTNLVAGRLHDRGPGAARRGCIRPTSSTAARQDPGLFPRLRFRGGEAARRQVRRALDRRAHHHRHRTSSARRKNRVEFNLRQHGKEYRVTEGAIVVLDTDGAVRAIVGGRDYGESQFNRATRRCARPARRSSPMSTPPPWSTASRRSRSFRMGRSAGAVGRRRTTPAAITAA